MSTVIIEATEGSYVLPPEIMDIKLVRIISDINKPLDKLTIKDICDWHNKTNSYIEFSYKLPDKYSVEYTGHGAGFRQAMSVDTIECPPCIQSVDTRSGSNPYGSNVILETKHNLKIEVGDKIRSDIIRNGGILKCMSIDEDGVYLSWEDFTGHMGYDLVSIFKKYVPGVDSFILVDAQEKTSLPKTSKILNTFRLNTGELIVHVFDKTFKKGDYVLGDIYIRDIFEYSNYYGLVLNIDTKKFEEMGYEIAIYDNKIHLVNAHNPILEKGTIILPGIIIDKRSSYKSFTTEVDKEKFIYSIRIYDQAFHPGHDIKKYNNKNYYDNTGD